MLQKLRRLPKSKMGLNERRISGRTGDVAVGEVVPASAEFKSSDTVNILDAMTRLLSSWRIAQGIDGVASQMLRLVTRRPYSNEKADHRLRS